MSTAIAYSPTTKATSPAPSSRTTLGAPREPVLVALKPYEGHEAALSFAQWLALSQSRPLHAVTVLESNEMVTLAAGVPVLPEQFRAEERAAIADQLEERLARTARADDPPQRVDVVHGPPAHEVVDIAREREAHAKRFYSSKRHTIEVDFETWMRDSERELQRGAERAAATGGAPPRARREPASEAA
jgi:hypothetical protein